MTSQVWKVPTSYTNKLRGGLTTWDGPRVLTQWRIFRNEKRRDERWEECWQWLWRDTDGCWEGGMIQLWRLVTPRWWADDISSWEELSTVTWCHIVNIIIIIDSQKIEWQVLVAYKHGLRLVTSLWLCKGDHYLLKQRILVKCLDDVGWQAYFVAIKKLSSSSFFLWPLYFADFLMSHSDVLTMAWMVGSSFWGWGRTWEKACSKMMTSGGWGMEMEATWASAHQQFLDYYLQRRKMGMSSPWERVSYESILWWHALSPEIDGHRKNLIWNISDDPNYFYESSFVTYHGLEWDNGGQGRRDIEMINGWMDWIDYIQGCPFTNIW